MLLLLFQSTTNTALVADNRSATGLPTNNVAATGRAPNA
jgi:hypothetical protein